MTTRLQGDCPLSEPLSVEDVLTFVRHLDEECETCLAEHAHRPSSARSLIALARLWAAPSPPGACPPEDVLLALVLELGSYSAQLAVARHVVSCERCEKTVNELADRRERALRIAADRALQATLRELEPRPSVSHSPDAELGSRPWSETTRAHLESVGADTGDKPASPRLASTTGLDAPEYELEAPEYKEAAMTSGSHPRIRMVGRDREGRVSRRYVIELIPDRDGAIYVKVGVSAGYSVRTPAKVSIQFTSAGRSMRAITEVGEALESGSARLQGDPMSLGDLEQASLSVQWAGPNE
ncbi:MAG: hypothetical protein HYV07_33900 [Deltaproteobacteria bacterium]|nr:hypothetical protein [Deltaproteobacteria bacterium]